MQVQPIFTASCASGSCHGTASAKAGLDLSPGKSYAELVNVTASQCNGRKLVAPGAPASSYLMDKLLNINLCAGSAMPKGVPQLPQSELALVSNWICSGAPNN
jgi:hypothetical protein